MAYALSKRSQKKLDSCHPKLQQLVREVLKVVDVTVVHGHRNEAEQNEIYDQGFTKKRWPDSKHNRFPSEAVDLAPYNNGIDWNDLHSFYFVAGVVMGIASRLGIKIRFGGDWNMNGDLTDESFLDLGHFELV